VNFYCILFNKVCPRSAILKINAFETVADLCELIIFMLVWYIHSTVAFHIVVNYINIVLLSENIFFVPANISFLIQ